MLSSSAEALKPKKKGRPVGGLWLNRTKALCPAGQGPLSTTRSRMGRIITKALESLDMIVLSD
jgi:hypothetical protein